MKKIIVITALCIFIIQSGSLAYAVDTNTKEPPVGATGISTQTGIEQTEAGMEGEGVNSQKVEYTLPYPGILINHPLYFLKRFRDQILEAFISDPVKKLEFAILQTDKFLNMGIMYANDGKWNLAAQTLSLSEASMAIAVKQLGNLKDTKEVPGQLIIKIQTSLKKHIEVVEDMSAHVADSEKDRVSGVLTAFKNHLANVQK
jgi:hypothetical protein